MCVCCCCCSHLSFRPFKYDNNLIIINERYTKNGLQFGLLMFFKSIILAVELVTKYHYQWKSHFHTQIVITAPIPMKRADFTLR